MNKRVFFLNNGGWFEEEISEKLLNCSREELILWAYAMMERKNYRNYLVTENPVRVLTDRPGHIIGLENKKAS